MSGTRIIKKGKEDNITQESEPEVSIVDDELSVAVSRKLSESTILIRNILSKQNIHTEMEIGALLDALISIEIANENPARFAELQNEYFSRIEEKE